MRKVLSAFGIKPNGSPTTFQGQYRDMIKMMVVIASVAYTLGITTMSFRDLPGKVKAVEQDVAAVKTSMARFTVTVESIDGRLARIENCLLNGGKRGN